MNTCKHCGKTLSKRKTVCDYSCAGEFEKARNARLAEKMSRYNDSWNFQQPHENSVLSRLSYEQQNKVRKEAESYVSDRVSYESSLRRSEGLPTESR